MSNKVMTSRERILAALRLEVPDQVPIFDSIFAKDIYLEMLGHRPRFFNPEDACNCAAALGMDAGIAVYRGYPGVEPEEDVGEEYESEWGVTYGQTPPGWPGDHGMAYKINTRAELERFTPPDPNEPGRLDPVKRAAEVCARHDLALITALRGPFAHAAWHFLGMMETCMGLLDDPDFVSLAVRMNTDFNVELSLRLAEAGADVFWITEDLGSNNQPLINPRHYREIFLPHLRELVDTILSLGKPVVLHSDGYIMPFLPDLVETGISGLNPIQQSANMDLAQVKAEYGDRLCLVGNVDNYNIMERGTPEQVEAAVKECIQAAGAGGGYILASDHTMHEPISAENVRAFVEAGHKWGQYPLDWIANS